MRAVPTPPGWTAGLPRRKWYAAYGRGRADRLLLGAAARYRRHLRPGAVMRRAHVRAAR